MRGRIRIREMIESEDLHEMEIPNSLRERTWSQGFLLWNLRPSCNQTCPNNCMVRITWSLWLVQSGQRVVLSWCAAQVNRLEWSPLGPDISWITPISIHLSKTDGWAGILSSPICRGFNFWLVPSMHMSVVFSSMYIDISLFACAEARLCVGQIYISYYPGTKK